MENKPSSFRQLALSWPYETHEDFENKLRAAASAWFKAKGYQTHRCGYILKEYDNWEQNIIVADVAKYIKAERGKRAAKKQSFPLHQYIHHGLSSQAMLFNLAGPLIMTKEQDLSPFKSAFEKHAIVWPCGNIEAHLEDEDRHLFNEKQAQPTSIDLVIENEDKKDGIYIECKLVEHEFGGCSVFKGGDCDGRNPAKDSSICYLNHIGRKYWTLLDKYGFLNGPIGQNAICFLSTYYQFFREVLYAIEKRGTFVLLVDNRNPAFSHNGNKRRGLFPFLKSFVPDDFKDKVLMVSIQETVQAVEESGNHSWIYEFKQKYAMD